MHYDVNGNLIYDVPSETIHDVGWGPAVAGYLAGTAYAARKAQQQAASAEPAPAPTQNVVHSSPITIRPGQAQTVDQQRLARQRPQSASLGQAFGDRVVDDAADTFHAGMTLLSTLWVFISIARLLGDTPALVTTLIAGVAVWFLYRAVRMEGLVVVALALFLGEVILF